MLSTFKSVIARFYYTIKRSIFSTSKKIEDSLQFFRINGRKTVWIWIFSSASICCCSSWPFLFHILHYYCCCTTCIWLTRQTKLIKGTVTRVQCASIFQNGHTFSIVFVFASEVIFFPFLFHRHWCFLMTFCYSRLHGVCSGWLLYFWLFVMKYCI